VLYLAQRGNPAHHVSDECSDAQSEPRTEQGGHESRKLGATVSGGETLIRREFVTAEPGDVVTLTALLGSERNRVDFQFLPAGGADGDAPPEVACLTFENAVEASATWSATGGV
jgi:hypothetical protein